MKLDLNWWDRLLIALAPSWGLKRAKARAETSLAIRGFDAAGGGRRTTGWRHPSTDANAVNAPSLPKLRDLCRDLRRNNGLARRCVEVVGANTVGWGISAKSTGAPTVETRAQEIWKLWSENPGCDYDGRMPFKGLQRLVMDTIVESGECLVLNEPAAPSDGLPVPLRIRVLEPDFLDVNKQGKGADGGQIIQGIEFDKRGRRVAYWIYAQHPGSAGVGMFTSFASNRVPASDVLHIYRVDRPGQMRGVPWLASTIAKLNDYDDYDDALLMQAKVGACFGAIVTDMDGERKALGEQDADSDELESLEPGQIQYLSPGREVTFAQPPSTSDHGGFSVTQIRRIAGSVGITYEDLSTDYSGVNFSSARMARLSHWQNVHNWRWNMLIPQFCDGVWGWVMGLAAGMEDWPETPSAVWSPPPMPMINPEKEGLASQRLVRGGFKSLTQAIREQGRDPETHLAEIAASNADLDKLGIILDSDPRKTTVAGMVQAEDEPAPPAASQGDDEDE